MGLDQYLQRVQGLAPMLPQTQYGNSQSTGNGAQTSPLYNNPMAGAMGGAMLGSTLLGAYRGVPRPVAGQTGTGGTPYNWGAYGTPA
jgi:hypothetical protein